MVFGPPGAKKVSYEHFKILMKIFVAETKNDHNLVKNQFSGVGREGKCRGECEECDCDHFRG